MSLVGKRVAEVVLDDGMLLFAASGADGDEPGALFTELPSGECYMLRVPRPRRKTSSTTSSTASQGVVSTSAQSMGHETFQDGTAPEPNAANAATVQIGAEHSVTSAAAAAVEDNDDEATGNAGAASACDRAADGVSASTTAHEPVDDGATLAFGEEEDSDDEPAHEPVDDGATLAFGEEEDPDDEPAHEPVDDGATLAFGEEEDSDDEPTQAFDDTDDEPPGDADADSSVATANCGVSSVASVAHGPTQEVGTAVHESDDAVKLAFAGDSDEEVTGVTGVAGAAIDQTVGAERGDDSEDDCTQAFECTDDEPAEFEEGSTAAVRAAAHEPVDEATLAFESDTEDEPFAAPDMGPAQATPAATECADAATAADDAGAGAASASDRAADGPSASTTAHEPVDDGATLAFGEEEDSDDCTQAFDDGSETDDADAIETTPPLKKSTSHGIGAIATGNGNEVESNPEQGSTYNAAADADANADAAAADDDDDDNQSSASEDLFAEQDMQAELRVGAMHGLAEPSVAVQITTAPKETAQTKRKASDLTGTLQQDTAQVAGTAKRQKSDEDQEDSATKRQKYAELAGETAGSGSNADLAAPLAVQAGSQKEEAQEELVEREVEESSDDAIQQILARQRRSAATQQGWEEDEQEDEGGGGEKMKQMALVEAMRVWCGIGKAIAKEGGTKTSGYDTAKRCVMPLKPRARPSRRSTS